MISPPRGSIRFFYLVPVLSVLIGACIPMSWPIHVVRLAVSPDGPLLMSYGSNDVESRVLRVPQAEVVEMFAGNSAATIGHADSVRGTTSQGGSAGGIPT